ncbi:MAG: acyl-CoA dehydrogenase, partial [Okeania sp. SIO3H1]|nr:acyl-CoA dehydrogenase [Okeania sp. SIO3H1]
MTHYTAPIVDSSFLLNDVFDVRRYGNLPVFKEMSEDLIDAILTEAGKLASDILHPVNASGDAEGCVLHGSDVKTPEGFQQAYRAYADGGWMGLSCDPDYGGQGLPFTLLTIVNEYLATANMAFAMYPGLSQGAYSAIWHHGDDAQKRAYLPNIVSGQWSGTMNLTEPHCGTDLGLLKTKAVPQADGTYRISGAKIFISAGEHDLTENIIHLVLARIEGAPEGTKGISLFIVPKILVNDDGTLGARNEGVRCARLEDKMGIHANATCEMLYDDAIGYLIGAENRGLNAMFTMMNEARLGVAIQGLAQSEIAYQNAAAYAKDRRQGRALSGPVDPEAAADPIIVHPDVRRTLLKIRAFNEAARALAIWGAIQSDVINHAPDEAERQKADDLLGLLTPVMKGVMTDLGFENAVEAQQMLGGHGYIREWGMEQFVRDARIAKIYEGANGVQALDLVGRKLARNGGRAVMTFFGEIDAFVKAHANDNTMADYLTPLVEARKDQ